MTREEAIKIAEKVYPDFDFPCDKPNIISDDARVIRLQREAYVEGLMAKERQPYLPKGLDEAARKYAGKKEFYWVRENPYTSQEWAFKAGAEWAFGQGVTVEGKIVMDFSEPRDIINRRLVANLGDALLKVEPGDVLILIRKK